MTDAHSNEPPGSPAEKFLFDLPRFALVGRDAYKPGLERMMRLMDAIGRPHTAFPSIHVAGTNGKGSTASFIAAIGTATGRRVGLHTSPHLLHVGERMRVDGTAASPGWIEEAVERHADLIRESGASFFEATTALSFEFFAEMDVDLAVVEVGLGGRFDATNVLSPRLSVITSVALDHEEILGDSIEQIAAEKAGIIKPGVPVLAASWDPSVLSVIGEAADLANAPFHVLDAEVKMRVDENDVLTIVTPEQSYDSLALGVVGRHQQRNAGTAVRAVELASKLIEASPSDVRRGLLEVRSLAGLRGRTERLSETPPIYVDVAHNAEAMMAAVKACLDDAGRIDRLYLGLMKDKHLEPFAAWLAGQSYPVTTLSLASERARTIEDLASHLKNAGVRSVEVGGSVSESLGTLQRNALSDENARREVSLFLGSHMVVADAIEWSART